MLLKSARFKSQVQNEVQTILKIMKKKTKLIIH